MTVTFNDSHKDPTAMRLLLARFVQFLLFKLAIDVVCQGCGKHHVLPMQDEIFDLETMRCFDCAEHEAFINEAYDRNCEERSWGEDCTDRHPEMCSCVQCIAEDAESYDKSHPFTVKCGAGCGNDIRSNVQLPPTTLCYKCEQDIPF